MLVGCRGLSVVLVAVIADAVLDPFPVVELLEEEISIETGDVLEDEALTVLLLATVIDGAVPGAKRAVLDFSARGIYLYTPHMTASL